MTAPQDAARVSDETIRDFADAIDETAASWTIRAETSGPLSRIVLRAGEVKALLRELLARRRGDAVRAAVNDQPKEET